MKCPQCVELGLKSTISVGVSMTTCMYFSPFYDEEGRYHNHDKNTTTTQMKCSNGHEWAESTQPKCWCEQ